MHADYVTDISALVAVSCYSVLEIVGFIIIVFGDFQRAFNRFSAVVFDDGFDDIGFLWFLYANVLHDANVSGLSLVRA